MAGSTKVSREKGRREGGSLGAETTLGGNYVKEGNHLVDVGAGSCRLNQGAGARSGDESESDTVGKGGEQTKIAWGQGASLAGGNCWLSLDEWMGRGRRVVAGSGWRLAATNSSERGKSRWWLVIGWAVGEGLPWVALQWRQ